MMSEVKLGRPSKYKEEYAEQARKLCLLGATDAKLADFFEVDEATINRWKHDFPEFCKSLKAGKMQADAEIAESLFNRARGYVAPDIDIKMYEGQIIETPYMKHYPPDATSMIFWLKNRQPDLWREKREAVEVNDDNEITINVVRVSKKKNAD